MTDDLSLRSRDLHESLERTAHRALLHCIGIPHAEMAKPLVAIVNSWTEVVPGHMHLRALGELVKQGVREAGGNPLEFDTIAVCDGMAQGHIGMSYSLPSREAIADTVEIMLEGHRFDAAVMISSCDKIEPGQLLAALRVNIPTVLLTGGPMEGGTYKEHTDITLSTMREFAGQVKVGKLSREELTEIEKAALPGPGSCSMMGTANTMACLLEALGMSPTGCATMLAVDPLRPALAREAGRLVIDCVRQNLTPRRIVTRQAIENAMAVDMALGGSTNSVLHLLAIAHEAGIPLALDEFDAMARRVPHLCNVKPSGKYAVGRMDEAGGVPALMHEIRSLLHLDVPTVTGKTLGENIAGAAVTNREMIRPLSDPLYREGGLAILRGSLAPEGAVVKQTGIRFKTMLAPPRSGPRLREHGRGGQGVHGGRGEAGGDRGGALRGPQGRARHAGDAPDHLGDGRHGPGRALRSGDGRPLLRLHARALYRPRLPGGRRGRPDGPGPGRRPDRVRHSEPPPGPPGGGGRTGAAARRLAAAHAEAAGHPGPLCRAGRVGIEGRGPARHDNRLLKKAHLRR